MSENKKPRLAEVLGVEVGEKCEFVGGGFNRWYYVDSEGWLRDRNGNIDNTVIAFLFKCPQYIRRKPRWTEQEVEDAKAIKRIFEKGDFEFLGLNEDGCPVLSDAGYIEYGCATTVKKSAFPSLKPGDNIWLGSIIEENDEYNRRKKEEHA